MPTRVVWDGLDEYRKVLAALPEDCAGEAANLVQGTANGVAHDIKSAYPARTGNLRDKVQVAPFVKQGLVVGQVVKNTANHAVIFEYGTQARHNALGANRGSMPPGRVFVPRVVKARRRLTDDLKAMVTRHGAVVTGE